VSLSRPGGHLREVGSTGTGSGRPFRQGDLDGPCGAYAILRDRSPARLARCAAYWPPSRDIAQHPQALGDDLLQFRSITVRRYPGREGGQPTKVLGEIVQYYEADSPRPACSPKSALGESLLNLAASVGTKSGPDGVGGAKPRDHCTEAPSRARAPSPRRLSGVPYPD